MAQVVNAKSCELMYRHMLVVYMVLISVILVNLQTVSSCSSKSAARQRPITTAPPAVITSTEKKLSLLDETVIPTEVSYYFLIPKSPIYSLRY